mmetsp:Transcript_37892/g.64726  ORF Transcript_37892/g.64726 Transcript_37892/m.64726 type:complete len:242 (-) Transcript_37892:155-880(-)
MSNQSVLPVVEAALAKASVNDCEARKEFSQRIMDYANGCNISSVLSERLTPDYMFNHLGTLERPEPEDLERLRGVEAYKIVFQANCSEFPVDRRSIFEENQGWASYRPDRGVEPRDVKLIEAALQKWFKDNVFMKDRVEGAESSVVDRLVKPNIKVSWGIGECLKYGILHNCFEFPESLHGANEQKPMFITMYARLLNVPSSSAFEFPSYRIWEHEELRFQMEAVTYSDERYLAVHMPAYC